MKGDVLMHIRSPLYLRILKSSTPLGPVKHTVPLETVSLEEASPLFLEIPLPKWCLQSSLFLLDWPTNLFADDSWCHARHLLET
jgi:hypothetical protein